MNVSKRIFLLALQLVLAVSVFAAAPLIPLRKGTAWIYEGTVRWQQAGEIKSKKIRWTTGVIDVFKRRKILVAIVRGFPSELAWYEEGKTPEYSVVIATRTNIYHVSAVGKNDALRLAREFSRRAIFRSADSILSRPLPGRRLCRFHIKGISTRRQFQCEQSTRRTNPDIETIKFARGLGIVGYHYNHFGTTSTADVELKEVRFAGKIL